MARPVGRPPDNLAAQLRAWYVSPTTREADRAFLQGLLSAWDMEIAARNGEEPAKRTRPAKCHCGHPKAAHGTTGCGVCKCPQYSANDAAQPEIPLREPGQ